MYNNSYLPNYYNQQASLERINEQISQLENLKKQMQQPQPQQPTSLTQNFQLAPTTRDVIRYASSMEEVQRDVVIQCQLESEYSDRIHILSYPKKADSRSLGLLFALSEFILCVVIEIC